MYKTWTDIEKKFMLENALNMTDVQLHGELVRMGANHSLASVRKFRQRNGLAKKSGRPTKTITVVDVTGPNLNNDFTEDDLLNKGE